MNGSRIVVALAVVAALLTVGAVGTTTAAADSPPPECENRDNTTSAGPAPECENISGGGDTVNGVDAITFWKLWTGDGDGAGDPALDDADDATQLERVRAISAVDDFDFPTPPAAAATWNENDHGDFSPGGDLTAKVPSGASTYSDIRIVDAHVTIFSVGPSTVVHKGGSTTRYIDSDGTVRGVADFRIDLPEPSDAADCPDDWHVDSTSTTVNLTVEGTVVDTTSSKTPTLQYSGLSGSNTFQLTATYEATIEHEDYDEECDDDGNCWCELDDTDYDDYRLGITSETVEGAVYNPPTADARELEWADSSKGGVVVQPGDEWATVTLGDAVVYSGWRFYTRAPDGWGEMTTVDDDGTSTAESSVRPLEIHAYPINRTALVNVTDSSVESVNQLTVSNVTAQTRQGTTGLPAEVDLNGASQYDEIRSLVATSPDTSNVDISDGQITGLVRGTSNTVTVDGPATVRSVTIDTVSHTVQSDGTHVYEFELTDDSGNPVTNGDLVVEGQSFDVSGGTVTATVSNPGYTLNARYAPGDWADVSQPYQEDDLSLPVNAGSVPSPIELFQFALMVFAWLIPFVLLGVALDFFLGTTFFRDSIPSTKATFRAIRDAILGGDRE